MLIWLLWFHARDDVYLMGMAKVCRWILGGTVLAMLLWLHWMEFFGSVHGFDDNVGMFL